MADVRVSEAHTLPPDANAETGARLKRRIHGCPCRRCRLKLRSTPANRHNSRRVGCVIDNGIQHIHKALLTAILTEVGHDVGGRRNRTRYHKAIPLLEALRPSSYYP